MTYEINKIIIEADDAGEFRIELNLDEHQMNVVVHECVAKRYGNPLYSSNDGTEPVYELEHAEPYLVGSIKWDHCSNWSEWPDHFCGREEAAKLGKLIDRLYELAAKHIPLWQEY